MKFKILIILTFIITSIFSQNKFKDSINNERRLDDIEHIIKRIDNNQLNYKIEKDLLKETYSNNYENINLIVTLILAVMGILGYLGLKDIGGVKKEYMSELSSLKTLKSKFEIKTKELDERKKEFDLEIKSMIEENNKQNQRIKFIELKDKAESYLREDNITSALEFINAALEINPKDVSVIIYKARVLSRLNNFSESIAYYKEAIILKPNDHAPILNLMSVFILIIK